jgi:bifunctional UDP-N-acetylglucosamine pyrophosphorylase/glucosamine-1-phosphate N-acetyltransferase
MRSALPKVLQPLAGRPLLAHVLARARELGPAAIHIVYGHGGEHVRAAFADSDLSWAHQAEQLGTGHAVARALPHIPDDHEVLILCGDVPLVRRATLERLLDAAHGKSLALVTALLDDPAGYGRIVRSHHGDVERIVEHADATAVERGITEVNTGLMSLPAARLKRWVERLGNHNAQGEYYLTDIISMAFAEGVDVLGIRAEGPEEALGINDKRQLAMAEREFQRGAAEALLEHGATLADPARIDVRGNVTIGKDVFIDVGVVLCGNVNLGDGVRLEANVVVTDCTLGAGTTVRPFSVLEGARTAAGCEIGPFARLRPGTELAADVKVGNYVEVKNSQVAAGTKMNHLSYVGDATVGADVNIGAGTITCNYDGANKHRTTIGDDRSGLCDQQECAAGAADDRPSAPDHDRRLAPSDQEDQG